MQQALVKGIILVARLTDLTMSGNRVLLDIEGGQQIKELGLDARIMAHFARHIYLLQTCFLDLQKQLKDIGEVNRIGARVQSYRRSQRNTSNFSNSNSNRHLFSQWNPKNSNGQTYGPCRHKDSAKMNVHKEQSQ